MQNDPNKESRSWTKGLIVALAVFVAGMVFAGVFSAGLDHTNRTEFCTSCHTMQTNLKELEETKHWKNISGVHASCADCHVPKNFAGKMAAKVLAAKDVFHEILGTIDTPEKYEAHRLDMAQRVWAKMKANGSAECKSCHSFVHMDFSEQDRFARRKHENANDRGQSCIDCHKGVAHKLPKDAAKEEDEDKPASPDKPTADAGAAAEQKPPEAAAADKPATEGQPATEAPKDAPPKEGSAEEPKKDDKQG
jgi:cytochrome c-type protein NapC